MSADLEKIAQAVAVLIPIILWMKCANGTQKALSKQHSRSKIIRL
jgi:hypothetical protein